MIIFEKSTTHLNGEELEIMNSNRHFNRISKDQEQFTLAELEEEHRKSAELGVERYLIRDGGQYVGIIEFLMRNPSDQRTWLGLLVIHQALQGKGYGSRALGRYYEMMRERGVEWFRIGVLSENKPAHAFWSGQGFERLDGIVMVGGKEAVIYERRIPA